MTAQSIRSYRRLADVAGRHVFEAISEGEPNEEQLVRIMEALSVKVRPFFPPEAVHSSYRHKDGLWVTTWRYPINL